MNKHAYLTTGMGESKTSALPTRLTSEDLETMGLTGAFKHAGQGFCMLVARAASLSKYAKYHGTTWREIRADGGIVLELVDEHPLDVAQERLNYTDTSNLEQRVTDHHSRQQELCEQVDELISSLEEIEQLLFGDSPVQGKPKVNPLASGSVNYVNGPQMSFAVKYADSANLGVSPDRIWQEMDEEDKSVVVNALTEVVKSGGNPQEFNKSLVEDYGFNIYPLETYVNQIKNELGSANEEPADSSIAAESNQISDESDVSDQLENENALYQIGVEQKAERKTEPSTKGGEFSESVALTKKEFATLKKLSMNAMSHDMFSAAMTYGGPGYTAINTALRTDKVAGSSVESTVKALDSMFELPENQVPRPTVLYRSLTDQWSVNHFGKLETGDVYTDAAYVSTAANWDTKSRNGKVVFEIAVPAGAAAAPIPSPYSNENELLLPRDSKFEVVSNTLTPTVPTGTNYSDAVKYVVNEDLTTNIWFDKPIDGKPYLTVNPYHLLKVKLISAQNQVKSRASESINENSDIQSLDLRQLGIYQSLLWDKFDQVERGSAEYSQLEKKYDAAVMRRRELESKKQGRKALGFTLVANPRMVWKTEKEFGHKVCEICAGYDGREVHAGDELPPLHKECRCRVVNAADPNANPTQAKKAHMKTAADSFTLLNLPAAKHMGEDRDVRDYSDDLKELEQLYPSRSVIDIPKKRASNSSGIDELAVLAKEISAAYDLYVKPTASSIQNALIRLADTSDEYDNEQEADELEMRIEEWEERLDNILLGKVSRTDVDSKKEEKEEGTVKQYTEAVYLPGVHPEDHPDRPLSRNKRQQQKQYEEIELQDEDLEFDLSKTSGKGDNVVNTTLPVVVRSFQEWVTALTADVEPVKDLTGWLTKVRGTLDGWIRNGVPYSSKRGAMRDKLADVLDTHFNIDTHEPGDAHSSQDVDSQYEGGRDEPGPHGKQSSRKTASSDEAQVIAHHLLTGLQSIRAPMQKQDAINLVQELLQATSKDDVEVYAHHLNGAVNAIPTPMAKATAQRDLADLLEVIKSGLAGPGNNPSNNPPNNPSKKPSKKGKENEDDKKEASIHENLPRPAWVPCQLNALWRQAVEQYIEVEGGDPESDHAYESVVAIYKGAVKKHGPKVAKLMGSSSKEPNMGGAAAASLKTASRVHTDMALFAKYVLGELEEEDDDVATALDEAEDAGETEELSEPTLEDIDGKLDDILDFVNDMAPIEAEEHEDLDIIA